MFEMKYFLNLNEIENDSKMDQTLNVSSLLRNHPILFVVVTFCLFNFGKFFSVLQYCQKTCIKRSYSSDKKIDPVYNDLRMEIRQLSGVISEFQKNSQAYVLPTLRSCGASICENCRQNELGVLSQCNMVSKSNTYPRNNIDKEISERNWLRYLNEYVFNPNPRIVDTSELENMKRAYPNWYQF
ncbi:uncharacterized protein LOC129941763 [Eupeodes corollae]|uniref:uncharacterized protein LOC129941763 n=1 Tax=Eupeodes corollae TaxID=290404 RepID=UPI00248F987A|nr:uncharacterized protein LOC129941763 [Eupeodes corollae]